MTRIRPLAESINVLAGTEGLSLDAAYSAWADRIEAERKAEEKAIKDAKEKEATEAALKAAADKKAHELNQGQSGAKDVNTEKKEDESTESNDPETTSKTTPNDAQEKTVATKVDGAPVKAVEKK